LELLESLLGIPRAEAQAKLKLFMVSTTHDTMSQPLDSQSNDLLQLSLQQLHQYSELLKKYGIGEMEDLVDSVKPTILPPVVCQSCDIAGHTVKNCPEILKKTWFKNQSLLQSFVIFLRSATIHQIKTNDIYQFYLREGETIEDRCNQILTMGEDAEHLEINALLTFLGLGSTLFQIDREDARMTNTNGIQTYTLPDEKSIPKIFLLYRPGHYDLLYKQ